MLFSEMLSEIQNSGEEEQFYEKMNNELKPLMMQTPNWEFKIPILGKTMKAVNVLINSSSIEEFKKTKDYRYIHDFEYSGNFYNGDFVLLPKTGYKKTVVGIILRLLRL